MYYYRSAEIVYSRTQSKRKSAKDKSQAIDVALVLETVLSIFSLDEVEFLGYIVEVVGESFLFSKMKFLMVRISQRR